MKCKECGGVVDLKSPFVIEDNCSQHDFKSTFPCQDCGHLHFSNGKGVSNESGKKAFFRDGNVAYDVTHKDDGRNDLPQTNTSNTFFGLGNFPGRIGV